MLLLTRNPKIFNRESERLTCLNADVARGERTQLERIASACEQERHGGVICEPHDAHTLLIGAHHLMGDAGIEKVAHKLLIACQRPIGVGERAMCEQSLLYRLRSVLSGENKGHVALLSVDAIYRSSGVVHVWG